MSRSITKFQDIVIHISEQKDNRYLIRLRESPGWGEAQAYIESVTFEKLKTLNPQSH